MCPLKPKPVHNIRSISPQSRLHQTWANRHHADALAIFCFRRAAHKADECELGGAVEGGAVVAAEARDAGDEEDGAGFVCGEEGADGETG